MKSFPKYALAALLLLSACDRDGTGTTELLKPPVPAKVLPLTQITQSGFAGKAVVATPAVIVRDSGGAPVPNVPVTFTLSQNGGTLSGVPQTTDNIGVASLGTWTLPAQTGQVTLDVSAGDAPPTRFYVYVNPSN
ncbi:MAG TPA: Ig-like domain-containing protein [Longimicrobium sp.]|jgi:hypothetical protein